MSAADVNAVLWADIALLTFLAMILIVIIRSRSLFVIVMLSGLYSLICASWFVLMDAVDVALTEAAVGAGISTVLLLGTMLLTARTERKPDRGSTWVPLVVVVLTGLVLVYAAIDLPAVGDPYSPANIYVGLQYMERLAAEIDIPNAVTATLASYRGFDTWGESCDLRCGHGRCHAARLR
jgi:multicomponent Na+:H+ antiporter subunit B